MKVTIHGLEDGKDIVRGALVLEGGEIVARPPGMMRLQTILDEPVRDQKTGKPIWAETNPEAFLRNLKFTYRSAYLRAGDVEE